jgi:hypothetical protein
MERGGDRIWWFGSGGKFLTEWYRDPSFAVQAEWAHVRSVSPAHEFVARDKLVVYA